MSVQTDTIEAITNSFIARAGFTSNTGSYTYHENLVIDAVKGLTNAGMKANTTLPKFEKLEIRADYTAKLPCDYGSWLAIGYKEGNKIIALNHDPTISLWKEYSNCGDPKANEARGDSFGILTDYYGTGVYANYGPFDYVAGYAYGEFLGPLYGKPGGNGLPSFVIDSRLKEINFSTLTNKSETILIHYLPNTSGVNGRTLITTDFELREAIYSYVLMVKAQFNERKLNQVAVHEDRYNRMKSNAQVNMLFRDFSLFDFVNAIQYHQTNVPQ